MRIFIGADHRGFNLKEELKQWLTQQGHEVIDVGASSLDPDDDYVDYAKDVATSVQRRAISEIPARGIVLCGSGVGMDIVANRHKGIRCGLGISSDQIRAARHDDDINVLALASDYADETSAKAMIQAFLETEFSGEERYQRRLKQIDETLFS